MTPSRTVVSWIRIHTSHRCQAPICYIGTAEMRCALAADWEADRAVGIDGRPIDTDPPRLRCNSHFPQNTDTVEHRKESY